MGEDGEAKVSGESDEEEGTTIGSGTGRRMTELEGSGECGLS